MSAGGRITPASAGKSCGHQSPFDTQQDHPRECGEKVLRRHYKLTVLGSPPRVRGKGVSVSISLETSRITPASAGKSCSACFHNSIRKDHPRECGEKRRKHSFYHPIIGSPPRVRGKDFFLKNSACSLRITPASAGKSAAIVAHTASSGSPPRVRGKANVISTTAFNDRITPASAGKRILLFALYMSG